jgi:transglycosylase-like protein with SLT domain
LTTAQLQAFARAVALRNGVNPAVFLRQISQESGWNPTARSSAGALGIAQIMPSTAASWGVNPLNPREALAAAAHHDAEYLRAYKGSYQKMLAAYNAGPGAVASGAWRGYSQTTNYVRSILSGIGNPHNFARGSAAAGAGGGGTVGGGGGARPSSMPIPRPVLPPIQVQPMVPMATAQNALQAFIAAHTPQADPAQPVPPVASLFPTSPGSATYAGELSSIHSKLVK